MERRRRKRRSVNGILVLDKPAGRTSNDALQRVKWLYRAAKAGHTGSLDPLATGVLPLCFGEATKFSRFLLDADKSYQARLRFGVSTATGDADGEVLERRSTEGIDCSAVKAALAPFFGDIEQIPSMYSAIKKDGQPLYKLAHQGIEVEREPRQITIHRCEVVSFEATADGPEAVLDIACSKGTYIRTLAEDLGRALGCGAHVTSLRRTRAGPYELRDSYTVEQLESLAESGDADLDACLLSAATTVQAFPAVALPRATAHFLTQGQAVQVAHAPTQGWVRIYTEPETGIDPVDTDFLGVGEILDDGRVAPRRLLAASG